MKSMVDVLQVIRYWLWCRWLVICHPPLTIFTINRGLTALIATIDNGSLVTLHCCIHMVYTRLAWPPWFLRSYVSWWIWDLALDSSATFFWGISLYWDPSGWAWLCCKVGDVVFPSLRYYSKHPNKRKASRYHCHLHYCHYLSLLSSSL